MMHGCACTCIRETDLGPMGYLLQDRDHVPSKITKHWLGNDLWFWRPSSFKNTSVKHTDSPKGDLYSYILKWQHNYLHVWYPYIYMCIYIYTRQCWTWTLKPTDQQSDHPMDDPWKVPVGDFMPHADLTVDDILQQMVDGRNPNPQLKTVGNIPFFIGFQPSKVMQDFFHPQYYILILTGFHETPAVLCIISHFCPGYRSHIEATRFCVLHVLAKSIVCWSS